MRWNPARGIPGVDNRAVQSLLLRALAEAPESVLRKELRGPGRGDPGSVDIRIAGDQEIAELNARHLGRIGPTDVLSFPLFVADPETRRLHWGDIAFSKQTATRMAGQLDLPAVEEMLRYVLHGFLHLIGYDDELTRTRRQMVCAQERLLREFFRRQRG